VGLLEAFICVKTSLVPEILPSSPAQPGWPPTPSDVSTLGTAHPNDFPTPRAAYQRAARLEVMRIGPIEQAGFYEIGEMWFYHAIGSGIFVHHATFTHIDVHYERHKSVPRVEIVGHLSPSQSVASPSRVVRFWSPKVPFELYDGSACASTAIEKRVLSCANLPVPTWPGDDPQPTHPFQSPCSHVYGRFGVLHDCQPPPPYAAPSPPPPCPRLAAGTTPPVSALLPSPSPSPSPSLSPSPSPSPSPSDDAIRQHHGRPLPPASSPSRAAEQPPSPSTQSLPPARLPASSLLATAPDDASAVPALTSAAEAFLFAASKSATELEAIRQHDGTATREGEGASAFGSYVLYGVACVGVIALCVGVQAGQAGESRRRAARSSLSRHALRLREISLASRASLGRKRAGGGQGAHEDKERLMSLAEGQLERVADDDSSLDQEILE